MLQNITKAAGTYIQNLHKPSWQKGLLVATVGASCLSYIYPLRLPASLALGTTALLSSGINAAEAWNRENRFKLCGKIALVALGIVGVIAASRFLMAASVVADLGLQIASCGKALYHKEGHKALCHLGAVAIDLCVLGGLYTASWPFLLAAATVNAVVMVGLAFKEDEPETLCYLFLGAMGMVNAAITPPRLALYDIGKGSHPNLSVLYAPMGGHKIVTKSLDVP